MYIAIYLIIGIAVLLVHRYTKDRFSRERVITFVAFPELGFVLILLWPIFFVGLILRFAKAHKIKTKNGEATCIKEK